MSGKKKSGKRMSVDLSLEKLEELQTARVGKWIRELKRDMSRESDENLNRLLSEAREDTQDCNFNQDMYCQLMRKGIREPDRSVLSRIITLADCEQIALDGLKKIVNHELEARRKRNSVYNDKSDSKNNDFKNNDPKMEK